MTPELDSILSDSSHFCIDEKPHFQGISLEDHGGVFRPDMLQQIRPPIERSDSFVLRHATTVVLYHPPFESVVRETISPG